MWYKHPLFCLVVASGFVSGALVVGLLASSLMSVMFFGDWNVIISNDVSSTISTGISVYVGYFLYVKLFEKRPVTELGLASTKNNSLPNIFTRGNPFLELVYGFFLGTFLITFLVGIFLF
mgnify:CR=1 FL=1